MPSNMPDARAINEALRRAREMQSRSSPAPAAPSEPESTAAPEPSPEPNFSSSSVQEQANKGVHMPPASHSGSALDALLKDRDRLLILALLVLISGEDGNMELLFALMYLLI